LFFVFLFLLVSFESLLFSHSLNPPLSCPLLKLDLRPYNRCFTIAYPYCTENIGLNERQSNFRDLKVEIEKNRQITSDCSRFFIKFLSLLKI
jgi:hypothetical protein